MKKMLFAFSLYVSGALFAVTDPLWIDVNSQIQADTTQASATNSDDQGLTTDFCSVVYTELWCLNEAWMFRTSPIQGLLFFFR